MDLYHLSLQRPMAIMAMCVGRFVPHPAPGGKHPTIALAHGATLQFVCVPFQSREALGGHLATLWRQVVPRTRYASIPTPHTQRPPHPLFCLGDAP